jgi:hypothetical protein
MTLITEPPPTVAQQQQLYLQRVLQLYANIKDWLQDKALLVSTNDLEIEEVLGCYHVPKLAIATAAGDQLAEFRPEGASVVGAEGLILVKGWLRRGYVLYVRKNGYYYGHSEDIPVDGWYWEEQRLNTPPHLIDKRWLLELITWVSDYEFLSFPRSAWECRRDAPRRAETLAVMPLS